MWRVRNESTGKEQVWYSKKLIERIKDECVKAQDNTGALIYKIIEKYESEG